MPKDFLVQAAQAYIAQPMIQIGYKTRSGGLGTVNAIVMEHPIDIAQARSSITKRTRLDVQSSRIQLNIPTMDLIKEFYLQ
jgi:predicted NUDIX family NTP pyrophosphohydrolase